jgi:hypothetical protein
VRPSTQVHRRRLEGDVNRGPGFER